MREEWSRLKLVFYGLGALALAALGLYFKLKLEKWL